MNKFFTLAAMGLLSLATQSVSAQTLDGQVLATEGYTKLGEYSGTRGFGDHGLAALYVKTTSSKLYIALVGALETNGNSFQIYLNLPNKTGVASGTALPLSDMTGTSFEKNAAKMDMETDYGFAVKGGATASASSIIDYTRVTSGKATDQMTGDLPIAGTAVTAPATTTGGLAKTRMAFTNLNTLTAHAAAGGTAAWEIELDKADLGIKDGDAIQLFAVQNNNNGGYYSTDAIPAVTGNTTNLATDPDFTALAGTQTVRYVVTSTTATREAVARQLGFEIYPNPGQKATIRYKVEGQQQVSLRVMNVLGQEVSQVSERQSGRQSYTLPQMAKGTYIVRLRVGDQTTSLKVVLE